MLPADAVTSFPQFTNAPSILHFAERARQHIHFAMLSDYC